MRKDKYIDIIVPHICQLAYQGNINHLCIRAAAINVLRINFIFMSHLVFLLKYSSIIPIFSCTVMFSRAYKFRLHNLLPHNLQSRKTWFQIPPTCPLHTNTFYWHSQINKLLGILSLLIKFCSTHIYLRCRLSYE